MHRPEDLDLAFATFRRRPQAVIILPSPMIYNQSEPLAKLTIKHRIPATSMFRPFAEAGGAVAYGPDMASSTERAGILVAKILEGANQPSFQWAAHQDSAHRQLKDR